MHMYSGRTMQSLLKAMMPIGGGLFVGLFKDGRDYKKECKEARIDIDRRVRKAVNTWKIEVWKL